MDDFVVAKRGDYLLAKIFCGECGNEVLRSGKKGRPSKTCAPCKLEARAKKTPPRVEFAVNVNEAGEEPNFVKVEGDEFWRAMAAKALLRRNDPAVDQQG